MMLPRPSRFTLWLLARIVKRLVKKNLITALLVVVKGDRTQMFMAQDEATAKVLFLNHTGIDTDVFPSFIDQKGKYHE